MTHKNKAMKNSFVVFPDCIGISLSDFLFNVFNMVVGFSG
jgi:hypothetical protein